MNKHRKRAGRTLPVLAAVHRKKTSAQRRDPADAYISKLYLKSLGIDIGSSRRHVETVENTVNKDILQAAQFGQAKDRK